MIISKRSHLDKLEQERHLQPLLEELCTCDHSQLAEKLAAHMEWNSPPGNLLHWVRLLNHFDEILERSVRKYDLAAEHPRLMEMEAEDAELVSACLNFSKLLLDHCTNRSLYASPERVFSLLSTPCLKVKTAALEVALCIGERYVCGGHYKKFAAPRNVRRALLDTVKSFPPPVPGSFVQTQLEQSQKSAKKGGPRPSVVPYRWIDSLDPEKAYPAQWRSIHFEYFRAEPAKDKHSQKSKHKGVKKEVSEACEAPVSGTPEPTPELAAAGPNDEGAAVFRLSEDHVRRLSLPQIYERAQTQLPAASWGPFALAALNAKAFGGASDDIHTHAMRVQLLRIKCLAAACLACFCTSDFTAGHWLEPEPAALSYIIDFLVPTHAAQVPSELFCAASQAVRALASKRVWGSEIVRHLGANVHHGVLYAVLRGLRQSPSHAELASRKEGYQALFSALGDLVESSLAPRLVAGGLLRELAEFLRVDSTQNKVLRDASNAALRVLAQLLSGSSEFAGVFADDNGLPLVVAAVTREVDEALARPNRGAETPSLVPLLHSISVGQTQYLRTLLDFVSQLASSDLGDRLRTMFDSPLLAGLARIAGHPRVFGPAVLSAALDDVAQILHNEPTAFAILDEAGVVAAVLDHYADLFMPDGELLLALLEVLGALSLNTAGLRKVIDADVIKVFFRSFYDLASARDAVKSDMATNMGCSMDELGRHNPPLRPFIMKEVVSLVNTFGAYANEQLSPIKFYSSQRGNMYNSTTDLVLSQEPGQGEIESWEGMLSSNLIDNVFMFLNGLLQDTGQWGKDVIRNVPFSSWESFFTMPHTPFDFTVSTGVLNLVAVLKYLDDEVQGYGLSQILESLSTRLESPRLKAFFEFAEKGSYFASLGDNTQEATLLLQELNCVNNLLFVLTEIYLNPSSISNETNMALFDYLADDIELITKLVEIMQKSFFEEICIRTVLPDEVMEKTSPSIFYTIKSSAIRIYPREPPSEVSLDELSSAKFKNTLQLRFLADSLSNNAMVILSCIARSCMHRRQDFFTDNWRRTTVRATRHLAISLASMIATSGRLLEKDVIEFHLRMMHAISFISMYKDRGKEVIATSFVLFFYYDCSLAREIISTAASAFHELEKLSKDELDSAKELTFIRNTPASIAFNTLQMSLSFIDKILSANALNKFPLMSHYFNRKYCDNDNYPVQGIQLYTAHEVYSLLRLMVGTSSDSCRDNDYTIFAHMPFKVIEQLVDIIQHASIAFSGDDYYPLKEDWMTPAYQEVEYLTESFDMSESDAIQLLTFGKSIRNLDAICEKGEGMEIPDWEHIERNLREVNLSELFDYQPYRAGKMASLEDYRKKEDDQIFTVALVQIAALTSKIQRNVVMAYSNKGKLSDVIVNVVEVIQNVRQVEKGPEKTRSTNLIDLLEGLVCSEQPDESTHEQSQAALNKFYHMFLSDLTQNPKIADSDYCAAGLSLLLPVVSQTLPTEFSDRSPYFNVTLPESLREDFADVVLKLQPTNNVKSATLLGRHLYVLAKMETCKEKVIQSPLLSCFIQNMKTLLEAADKHSHEPLQDSIVLAVRTCFDDEKYIRKIFSAEVFRVMKKHSGSKRDLGQVVHECRSLIGRDPYHFLEVASGMVRLDDYDGRATGSEKVVLLSEEELKNKKSTADVEMSDPQAVGGEINSSGLVNLLLFQLMSVAKEDWYSTPEDETTKESSKSGEKKKDESDFRFLMRNKKFAYMTFLLQTLCELVGSYNSAKLEFITFTKKFKNEKKNKPRLTSLNFFIHQLIPSHVFMEVKEAEYQRRESISTLAKLTLLALVSTTVQENDTEPDPKKEDADMSIVRKLTVDMLSKILKETVLQTTDITRAYSKVYDVFDLCSCLLSAKFRALCAPLLSSAVTKVDQFYIASAFIDSNLAGQLASVMSSVDLNFPEVSKVVNMGLKTLSSLAKVKLSNVDSFEASSTGDKDDDDIEDDEDRDETPDLFRNSTLGMYDLELETDEEDEFYQDQALIPMSGSDIDEDESDNSDEMSYSDLGSDLEDGEIVEDDDDEDEDGHDVFEGFDSDDSQNHANYIGELEIASGEGSGFDDEDEDDMMSGPDDYEDRDEGETDYSDAELENWEELLADSSRLDEPRARTRFGESHDDDEEEAVTRSGFDSEYNSASEYEDETGIGSIHDRARTTRESITSFFNAIRPGGSPILSLNPSGLLAGTIQIGSSRNHDTAFPQLDAAFQALLNTEQTKNPLDHMLLKSSAERWSEAFNIYFRRPDPAFLESARSKLKDLIKADSLIIHQKKAEEKEKVRKKRAEALQKKREKARLQREAEMREREAAQETTDEASREPVLLWIGNRQVDISGTDIDPEFFEALPDDMREEVFTQHVRERRANAGSTGDEVREIDPDFLEALPEQIRNEILQQESMSRRFSAAGFGIAEEDEDDFDSEIDEELESEGFPDAATSSTHDDSVRASNKTANETEKNKKKTFAVPILDRAGVASLVKLLFLPRPINQRDQFYRTVVSVCKNKQTRSEVVNMIIAVLYDGMVSQKALERTFHHVNAKSRRVDQPQPSSSFPIGCSPITVGAQFIEVLIYLLEHVPALRLYMLTEHENPLVSKKHSRKSKVKKASNNDEKYPINLLFKLLDNPLLGEEHLFMDTLSSVLNFATKPLLMLRDKNKPAPASFASGFVPEQNLRLVINILASNECVNSTFRSTISSMHHLSLLPGAQKVLSTELSLKASELGELIIEDLKSLTRELKSTSKIDSRDNAIVDKFSSSSSDQGKLLRVLTALDYMYESQKGESKDTTAIEKREDLTNVYKHLRLGTLWTALSDCLRVFEENLDLSHIATALLPLIEALMVVCKHSKVKELPIKDVMKFEVKKVDFTKEPIESLFFSFTDEHKKILNQMVRSNPNLMSGPFSMLVRNSRVLEFDNKRNYFNRQLHNEKEASAKMSISIRREQVFLDSYRALFFKSVEEFKKAHLEINFKGEAGIDAGGVTREWYQVLSRQMFNPDYALFTAVASDENTYHPNRTSYINPEHLSFFKFIGRTIGKAIYDGCFLDCHFSRAVYKNILDRSVSLKDMENLDLEYSKSLMWMLENDITDIITEDFSVETDDYGEHKIIELVPDGKNIPVTEENKQDYVRLIVEYRLQTSVSEQMNNFITGFHEIIPRDLVAIFDEQELELLISGLPDIDVSDWQNNTMYNNYSASSEQIQWFWRAVKSFDNEERAKLLQFSTGTSKVPLNGFKDLRGANGVCKFSIHRDYGAKDRLPSSHTCFNQIDLPVYESYETLRGSLLLALSEGHEGFQLA